MQTGQKVRRVRKVRQVKHWLQHRVQPCSGFPCLKYHAATQLSIYRAVTGFPRVLNAAPRKRVGCRSMQTHRLSCTHFHSGCVHARWNVERGAAEAGEAECFHHSAALRLPFSGQLTCQRAKPPHAHLPITLSPRFRSSQSL